MLKRSARLLKKPQGRRPKKRLAFVQKRKLIVKLKRKSAFA